MANPEHLEILKQGVDVWNEWRENNSDTIPDLTDLNFIEKTFIGANFRAAVLERADFTSSYLQKSDFFGARLGHAQFIYTRLQECCFLNTDLYSAVFRDAELHGARLGGSALFDTVFLGCNFSGVDFSLSTLDEAIFANCNLKNAVNLEAVDHHFPSSIGLDTIYRSDGKIPESFLRGCGVPETFITYAKSLIDNPIEYYSCFISFTEKDDAFSERLYNDMQAKGVRCWRWKEDAKWGRTLRKEIDEAVRYYDKLVVICSKDSLNSPAVLEEIERALDKEDTQRRAGDEGEVLFPIRIDDHIFEGWESELKVRLTKKNIGDFRDWNGDAEKYRGSVERLVKDLNRPRK